MHFYGNGVEKIGFVMVDSFFHKIQSTATAYPLGIQWQWTSMILHLTVPREMLLFEMLSRYIAENINLFSKRRSIDVQ